VAGDWLVCVCVYVCVCAARIMQGLVLERQSTLRQHPVDFGEHGISDVSVPQVSGAGCVCARVCAYLLSLAWRNVCEESVIRVELIFASRFWSHSVSLCVSASHIPLSTVVIAPTHPCSSPSAHSAESEL
jgi:hypothetical protein